MALVVDATWTMRNITLGLSREAVPQRNLLGWDFFFYPLSQDWVWLEYLARHLMSSDLLFDNLVSDLQFFVSQDCIQWLRGTA